MYARELAGIATPIGVVTVTVEGPEVVTLTIDHGAAPMRARSVLLDAATAQIEQWFAGERTAFNLPLAAAKTARGEALRQGMIAIGYGETISYGGLAHQLGSSPRAIGQACARNPLPIIVPCHRVLAAGNVLDAYSGGDGPATKAWLLTHEAKQQHRPEQLF